HRLRQRIDSRMNLRQRGKPHDALMLGRHAAMCAEASMAAQGPEEANSEWRMANKGDSWTSLPAIRYSPFATRYLPFAASWPKPFSICAASNVRCRR
ncbi:MAG: hypothetical protein ACJ8EN_09195, partial [Xanthobacteraceae bacterium]